MRIWRPIAFKVMDKRDIFVTKYTPLQTYKMHIKIVIITYIRLYIIIHFVKQNMTQKTRRKWKNSRTEYPTKDMECSDFVDCIKISIVIVFAIYALCCFFLRAIQKKNSFLFSPIIHLDKKQMPCNDWRINSLPVFGTRL